MVRNPSGLLAVLLTVSVAAPALQARCARAEAIAPVAEDWSSYGGSAAEQRFSQLDEINDQTVQRLGLAWSLDLDGEHTLEGTPLEIGGVLYFTGQDSSVYAVDAAAGKQLWKWESESWKYRSHHLRYLFMANRGLAYWDGRVYVGTLDGRLVALDVKTGKPTWSTMTVASDSRQTITGAPRAFNGKIIIGNGGADFGARGYVTAYDAETGSEAWRFYTVPGDPAKPFGQPAEAMAAKTWTGQWWKWGGGGTAWDGITFDPELNRVYIGTGNSGPYNPRLRSPGGGDNLFLASIVAVDADTGKYVWHYQANPQEAWDYKATAQITLAQLTIDRTTGKLISAEKTGKVTWASRIDTTTGRPVEMPNIRYENGPATFYPGPYGSHLWQAMSYSPDTGLVYIPYMQVGGKFWSDDAFVDKVRRNGGEPIQGVFGGGTNFELVIDPRDPDDGKGALLAWDPVAQELRWKVQYPSVWNGGTLSTRGNLVFQGDADGFLHAYDATSGKELWRFDAALGISAPPISYRVDGKQYISVLVGFGGATGFIAKHVNRGWKYGAQPRRVLTFVLDGKGRLPETAPRDYQVHAIDDPKLVLDESSVTVGGGLFNANCGMCHGAGLNSSGAPAPDLRESQIAFDLDSFSELLTSGALQEHGMPQFTEFSDAERRAIWMYIRAGAAEAAGRRQPSSEPPKAKHS